MPPPGSDGNVIDFGRPSWEPGPSTSFDDDGRTIYFEWSGLDSIPPLRQGDRFSLTLELDGEELTLLDETPNFELMNVCGASCLTSWQDLRTK